MGFNVTAFTNPDLGDADALRYFSCVTQDERKTIFEKALLESHGIF